MATVAVFSGSAQQGLSGAVALSGDQTGSTNIVVGGSSTSFGVGAVSPIVEGGGMLGGVFTLTGGAGLLNLADAANICKTNTTGPLIPMGGYLAATKKLRGLYLKNMDATQTVTVTCPATLFIAGLGWVASQVIVVLQPLGEYGPVIWPNGSTALVAGSNDAIVLTPGAGTPIVKIGAIFG